MNNLKKGILLTGGLVILFLAAGCKTIQGRVALKGSEPYTYVVIQTETEVYKIVGDFQEKVSRDYQNKYIKVKGRVVKDADGPFMPAEFNITGIIGTGP